MRRTTVNNCYLVLQPSSCSCMGRVNWSRQGVTRHLTKFGQFQRFAFTAKCITDIAGNESGIFWRINSWFSTNAQSWSTSCIQCTVISAVVSLDTMVPGTKIGQPPPSKLVQNSAWSPHLPIILLHQQSSVKNCHEMSSITIGHATQKIYIPHFYKTAMKPGWHIRQPLSAERFSARNSRIMPVDYRYANNNVGDKPQKWPSTFSCWRLFARWTKC